MYYKWWNTLCLNLKQFTSVNSSISSFVRGSELERAIAHMAITAVQRE